MNLEELKILAHTGVILQVSAADLLQVIESLPKAESEPQAANITEYEPVSLTEACRLYHKTRKTVVKYIQAGIYKGRKDGAMWVVEHPHARAVRLNTNQ